MTDKTQGEHNVGAGADGCSVDMFDKAEVEAELNARLQASGIDTSDAAVQTIIAIVSGYYAQRTAEVLTKVRELLDKFQPDELH